MTHHASENRCDDESLSVPTETMSRVKHGAPRGGVTALELCITMCGGLDGVSPQVPNAVQGVFLLSVIAFRTRPGCCSLRAVGPSQCQNLEWMETAGVELPGPDPSTTW